MAQFRKKPVVIEAVQLGRSPQSLHEVLEFMGLPKDCAEHDDSTDSHAIVIATLEGDMRARAGDWIIRGVQGEVYPCKADIFAATYEPA